jgi:hypothetical protein
VISKRPGTGSLTQKGEEPQRLLTHEEVLERANRFNELVARERELQEFLLKLRFKGDYTQVMEQRRRHDEALAEIERIRLEGIVPIVAELNNFLKAIKAEEEAKKANGAKARGA